MLQTKSIVTFPAMGAARSWNRILRCWGPRRRSLSTWRLMMGPGSAQRKYWTLLRKGESRCDLCYKTTVKVMLNPLFSLKATFFVNTDKMFDPRREVAGWTNLEGRGISSERLKTVTCWLTTRSTTWRTLKESQGSMLTRTGTLSTLERWTLTRSRIWWTKLGFLRRSKNGYVL